MSLYEARFETSNGDGTGRGHRLILDAATLHQASRDALRWMRARQKTEEWIAEANKDDPDYRPYFGLLGFMRVAPWAPNVVKEDGSLEWAKGFAGEGVFEWKIDFPIRLIKKDMTLEEYIDLEVGTR